MDDSGVRLRGNELDVVLAENQRAEPVYMADKVAALHGVGIGSAGVRRGNCWLEAGNGDGSTRNHDNGEANPEGIATELLLNVRPDDIHIQHTYENTRQIIARRMAKRKRLFNC